jgi:hypothetical protein
MDMEFGKMKMNSSKVTIDWTKSKVLVFINGRTNKSIKDNSKTIVVMDTDSYINLEKIKNKGCFILAVGRKEKNNLIRL